jgi:hypothetical protein
MAYKMTFVATLVQCDASGNVDGDQFSFTASQLIADNPPTATDLNTVASALGAQIATQLVSATGFTDQFNQDQQSD